MIKVTKKDNESGERLLKRFGGYIKSTRLLQKLRGIRYNVSKPTKQKVRSSALSRERYRSLNKKKQFN